jgi:hypothetical protein
MGKNLNLNDYGREAGRERKRCVSKNNNMGRPLPPLLLHYRTISPNKSRVGSNLSSPPHPISFFLSFPKPEILFTVYSTLSFFLFIVLLRLLLLMYFFFCFILKNLPFIHSKFYINCFRYFFTNLILLPPLQLISLCSLYSVPYVFSHISPHLHFYLFSFAFFFHLFLLYLSLLALQIVWPPQKVSLMIITDKDGLTIRRIAIFYKFGFLWELNLYGHILSSFSFPLLKNPFVYRCFFKFSLQCKTMFVDGDVWTTGVNETYSLLE